jgi:hypothetical protein
MSVLLHAVKVGAKLAWDPQLCSAANMVDCTPCVTEEVECQALFSCCELIECNTLKTGFSSPFQKKENESQERDITEGSAMDKSVHQTCQGI